MQWSRLLRLVPAAVVSACSAGDLVLPPAPESAAATALQRAARISWTPVEGASRYVVLASTSSGVARETATIVVDDAVSPTVVPGLAGGPWYFRIVAVKDGYFSPASDVISAMPLAVGTAGLVPLGVAAWVGTSGDPAGHFGFPATGAGDVDEDGYDDLLIGEMRSTAGGTAYLYRGGPDGLGATPAWVALSTQTGANFGKGLSSPGDIDGDGWRDVLVGAADHDAPSASEGRAWLYPGTGDAAIFSDVEIWAAESDQSITYMGRFTAPAGDVNGDGFPDFAVDQHGYNNPSTNEGRVCVWYGGTGSPPTAPDWTDDSDQSEAFLGYALSPVRGDADGDGYDDLLAGAWLWNAGGADNAGAAFLYRGGPAGLEAEPSWMAEGENPNDQFGGAVSFVGDVDGDGFDDAIVGALNSGVGDNGRAYLYRGGAVGLATTAAWTFDGLADDDHLGMGAGAAGDVNGDGFADVLLGAYEVDEGANNGGAAYLFLGDPGGLAATPSWVWLGADVDGFAGGTVGPAGDVNGDGAADFAVGVISFEGIIPDNGKVRVFLGPPNEGPSVVVGLIGQFPSPIGAYISDISDPALQGDAVCSWDFGDGTVAQIVDPCVPDEAGYVPLPSHSFPPGDRDYVIRLRYVNRYGLSGEAFSTVPLLVYP